MHPKFTIWAKYIVYASLTVNGFLYIRDDYVAMVSALPPDASAVDYLTQFSTSIDTVAWLGLVYLFELETYAVPDDKWTAVVAATIRTLRLACYIAIGVAAWGYTAEAIENYDASPVAGVTDACQLADRGVTMQRDQIEYVEVTSENCAGLANDDSFFTIANEVSVLGESVLHHLQFQGWVDVENAYVWLIVVFLIEAELWMQNRDRFKSRVMAAVRVSKSFFYFLLIVNIFIWFYQEYYRYAWDAFLWIFGFWAIELNLVEWEKERLGELATASA